MILNLNRGAGQHTWVLGEQIKPENIVLGKKITLEQSTPEYQTIQFVDDFDQHVLGAGCYIVRIGPAVAWADERQVLGQTDQKFPAFAQDIQDSALSTFVRPLIGVRQLAPIHTERVQFSTWVARDDEQKALCKLFIAKTNGGCLVQVNSIRGYQKYADKILQWMNKNGATKTQGHLYHNLLKLSGFVPSEYTTKPLFGLSGNDKAGYAVCKMISTMISIARVNEQGIIEHSNDTEFLHDYRVALRKVRSLLSLMKEVFPKQLHKHLKQIFADIMEPTNRARDLDVYLLEQDALTGLIPEHLAAGLPAMFDDFKKEHSKVMSGLKARLGSVSYKEEINGLKALFNELTPAQLTANANCSVIQLVNKSVRKRYKTILKLGALIEPNTPDEQVHDLRLDCKKFRYLLEFFEELYDPVKMSKLLKKLKRLQNTLGAFNDFSVQQLSLQDYLAQGSRPPEMHLSVGALIMVLSQKQLEQRKLVELRFAEFADETTSHLVKAMFEGKNQGRDI